MVKKGGKARGRVGSVPSDDEVDEFHSNREKVLFEQAGEYAGEGRDEEEEDEEVMRLEESGEEGESGAEEEDDEGVSGEEEEEEGESGEEEEEEEEGWGGRKNYYGGDDIDGQMTQEAIRQQKNNLKELGIEDYIDEDMMDDWDQKAETFDTKGSKTMVINEQSTDLEKLDKSEKLELLTAQFPEFVPLLKELDVLRGVFEQLDGQEEGEIVGVKKTALGAYLGSLSSYFSLFIHQVRSGEGFSSMKDHPVMETILTTRQVWKEAESLEEDEFIDAEEHEQEIVSGEEVSGEEVSAEEASEDSSDDMSNSESDLESDSDIDISSKRQIKSSKSAVTGDYIESNIDDIDAEDKQKKRKSLRFYTSKIDQAQGKNATESGDTDLPYKERLFERKQRLLEEARKRGQSSMGEDLDGEDLASGDEQAANDINMAANDTKYYDSLKKSKENKKQGRKMAHKTAVKLAKEGKLASSQELADSDGKRALNFQIMKNKGLTAKKRKEVRNSRVKKRMKYDEAKKKLKSVRQVYNENQGPYEGEKTGIKKGLSRSVKLV